MAIDSIKITKHNWSKMTLDSMKKFMESQPLIRKRVFKHLKKNPMSWRELGDAIGLSFQTMRKFIHEEHDVEFVSLVKIENWITDEEKKSKTKTGEDRRRPA